MKLYRTQRSVPLLVAGIVLFVGCAAQRVDNEIINSKKALDYIDAGSVALQKGDLSMARGAFEIAEKLRAGASSADGLGCVALQEGKFREAERMFQAAISRDKSYGEAYSHLADLYVRIGDPELAMRYYERALDELPDQSAALNNFGVLVAEYDENEHRARELFSKAAVSGNHPTAEENRQLVESFLDK